MDFYKNLVNRLEDQADQDQVIHCARRFYRLYGDVFRALPLSLNAKYRRPEQVPVSRIGCLMGGLNETGRGRVLLTGAAGGIGSALAVQLRERGASLALIGRDGQRTGHPGGAS